MTPPHHHGHPYHSPHHPPPPPHGHGPPPPGPTGPPPPPHGGAVAPPAGADWGFPAPSSEDLAELLGSPELGWQASLIVRQAPAEIVVLVAIGVAAAKRVGGDDTQQPAGA